MKYVCSICGYVYDEEVEGTPFADLPESWTCPLCGAAKSAFEPETPSEPAPQHHTVIANTKPSSEATASEATNAMPLDNHDLTELSPGVLAAICSNLARGCEKQYHPEEQELFAQLAEYYSAQVATVAEPTLANLAELLNRDLAENYPALRSTAENVRDRGTLRICTWGEKVTRALLSLAQRYEREGEAMLKNTRIWVCSVCGFTFVGEKPPALCPVCKVPDWKFDEVTGRAA